MPQAILADERQPPGKASGVRPRGMAPKEHGAWGQLLIPLAVALGLGRPGLVAWALAAAAAAMFMAHEPLVVLLGQRGTRAVREASGPAWRRLALLLSMSSLFGGVGLVKASASVRVAILVSLGLLLVAVFGFLIRGKERSTVGELWIAGTLPFAAVPVTLAAGLDFRTAALAWASFALAFSAGIFGVRGIIKDYREIEPYAGWLGLGLVLFPMIALLTQSLHAGGAALLFWGAVAGFRALRPTPKLLKRIGWTLVCASVAQGVWLLVALRWDW